MIKRYRIKTAPKVDLDKLTKEPKVKVKTPKPVKKAQFDGVFPIIAGAILAAPGPRPYSGPISVGDVFAWEPDDPKLRELVVVTRMTENFIWTVPFDERFRKINGLNTEEVPNPDARFREAAHPTIYKPVPAGEKV